MATFPDWIELNTALRGDLSGAQRGLEAISRLAPLTGWAPDDKSPVRNLPSPNAAWTKILPRATILKFGPKSQIRARQEGDLVWLRCHAFLDEGVLSTKAAIQAYSAAVRLWAEAGVLRYALLTREGSVRCFPEVPVALTNASLVAIRTVRVDEAYDKPLDFWAAWDEREELGGSLRLAARGLNIETNADYLAHIMDGQWAMARAAKPKRTRYFKPEADEEELPVYQRGQPLLHPVGIVQEESTAEFSCYLKPGDHIRGHEIYKLWYLVKTGKFADGTEIKTVRVVFGDRWMAEQEKRPLLDIGCRVFAMVASGELEEIPE